jgi:hypothetical protein
MEVNFKPKTMILQVILKKIYQHPKIPNPHEKFSKGEGNKC